ncbi:MAG: alanyl-tRNA synthetase [Bacteroidetes bacterium]|nr:MAG: alanyl-tRNA synthetase [Bacteroidota bacterium]
MHFVMYVRGCGKSRAPDVTDELPALHFLSHGHRHFAHVREKRLVPETVVDHDMVSIALRFIVRAFHHAVAGSINFRSLRAGEIHAGVKFRAFVNRVRAPAEAGGRMPQVFVGNGHDGRNGGKHGFLALREFHHIIIRFRLDVHLLGQLVETLGNADQQFGIGKSFKILVPVGPAETRFPDFVRNRFGFENRAVNIVVALLEIGKYGGHVIQPFFHHFELQGHLVELALQLFLARRTEIFESDEYRDHTDHGSCCQERKHTENPHPDGSMRGFITQRLRVIAILDFRHACKLNCVCALNKFKEKLRFSNRCAFPAQSGGNCCVKVKFAAVLQMIPDSGKMMTANEIRQTFLDFFKSKGHEIVPSAPMVVKNDPTLMFNNSGMAPFKEWFLGNSPAKWPRVADTQKCLRVAGKHNDLEEVGVDTYHHTMFEMLGNWSFGDYFKKEAIAWSWELLTEVYKIPKDRLYVTVFEGSKEEGLDFDQEAFDCWKQFVAEDRILRGNKKDNFWEMGASGPCGPCSEVHVDCRTDEERKKSDGAKLVNNDHPQVIEIWNNVFMEFNRKADGSLEKLPAQHVDTGMGFERLVRVLQGKQSNYDTDVFQPLIQVIEKTSGKKYGKEEKTDIAMRVIADHIRTISFAIADGQLPSNNGAGYVIRRILRRAVRYGYTFLGFNEPFMYKLVPVLAQQMGGFFPELKGQQSLIEKVIQEEETSFLRTLGNGVNRFEDHVKKMSGKVIDGFFAFELFDTFGFPYDLTDLLAREKGLSVDSEGYEKYLKEQKDRSRAATAVDTDDWVIVTELKDNLEDQREENLDKISESRKLERKGVKFVGYETLECDARIVRYRRVKAKGKESYQLVLDVTPFYAESGGQVGDTGVLETANEKIRVTDTKKENGVTIHFVDRLPEDVTKTFRARVDASRRSLTENNHSATHLLHAALRSVLGTHVEQKGSLVNDEYLRFDFSHFSKVTDEELAKIEQIVNEKIRENIAADIKEMPIDEAKKLGAMALFGEKYGDVVRVVVFDKNYSIELCGGTHVPATGKIGLFKIISESAIAAGVRRIEAISAVKAEAFVNGQLALVNRLKETLKGSKDLEKSILQLVEEKSALEKQVAALLREKSQVVKGELLAKMKQVNGVNFIAERVELSNADVIKDLAFELRGQQENLFLVLGAEINGKASLTLAFSDDLVKAKNLDASKIIRELAKEIQGGGGGQVFYATSGGSNVGGIPKALEKAKTLIP